MERITDLELQIKSIDLALEVSKTLMRDNQTIDDESESDGQE